MARRVGIGREQVVDAAAGLLAGRSRPEDVALSQIADTLGVRTQSLYAHVDGVDDLRRELALRGLRELAARLGEAAIGRAGGDAVEAIVLAWVRFASEHPGLYAASLRAPGDDPDLTAAVADAVRPLDLVFRSCGLAAEEAMHWHRTVFATVHGFVTLRRDGLLTVHGDPDDTVRHFVRLFARALERR